MNMPKAIIPTNRLAEVLDALVPMGWAVNIVNFDGAETTIEVDAAGYMLALLASDDIEPVRVLAA